jgi:hypothetical protein
VNTGTVPPAEGPDTIATYRLDGQAFAISYADLWDAPAIPVLINELGNEVIQPSQEVDRVWTGMGEAGSVPQWNAAGYIGNGGASGATNAGRPDHTWYTYGFYAMANTHLFHLYAISDVITVGGTPADPYADWSGPSGYNLTGGPADDDDGDGMSNFEEFAFGLDPTSGASINPITDLSTLKSAGTFSYTRLAGSGLTYTVWTSTTLLANEWTFVPAAGQEAGAAANGVETVRVSLPSIPPGDKLFVRVKAEK